MKGDLFYVGDVVRITKHESFKFNNRVGTIVRNLTKEDGDCLTYMVSIGGGINVVTCSCYLTLERAPMLPADWGKKLRWCECSWSPDLRRLTSSSRSKLQAMIAAHTRKRLGK